MPRSALPSFVTTTKEPVSATAKLTPVIPASAARNLLRRSCRARAVRASGSSSPTGAPISFSKSFPTSERFKWIAGITIWLGGSFRSCTIRSPRSVSMISIPRASRNGLSPHSSVSIDLLFTTRRMPRSSSKFTTIWLCSSASRAQCTTAPASVAAVSNWRHRSGSRDRASRLIVAASSRSASQSGTVSAASSRFARTNHRDSSCHFVRLSSRTNSRARST